MKRFFLVVIFIFSILRAWPGQIDKGFTALRIYDYFKAKSIFYSQLKNHPAEASLGLATIFFRNDNPFHQLDSASKYIYRSLEHWKNIPAEKKQKLKNGLGLSDSTVLALHDSICTQAYLKMMRKPTVESLEKYTSVYYRSPYNKKVICLRDSIIFHAPDRKLNVEFFKNYIYNYPQSCYLSDARNLLEFAIYMETTADKTDKAFLTYIEKYPKGKYIPYAKEELLNYYIKNKNGKGIYSFITSYGASYPTTLAWNMLLGIEAPHHTKAELETFLNKYADYPKREEILEEFIYWQTPFFLIHKNNKIGYCDSVGKIMIDAEYSDAEDFSEGYAAVQKDETYGYINKAGKTKIDFQYSEASGFSNNVAIVQKDNKYFLIDYSNKILSAKYDDITDFTEGMAIVKKNNQFGAINQNGQEIIKPSFDIISDFAEGYAVFLKNGKYGFLDKQGFVAISPIYEWVSSFKNGQCRAQYNKLFGVLDRKGNFKLQPAFDLIDESHNGIYLVVKDDLYGFADSSGCVITEIKYSYQPGLKTALLTDGKFVKLITSKKQELQNINGAKFLSDHTFEEVSLPVNNVVAVKEKGKINLYNLVKPAFSKKSLGEAISDGKYWYITNKNGLNIYDASAEKLIFTIEADKASQFNDNVFLVENEDGKGLYNRNGLEVIPMQYDEIRPTSLANLLYLERNEKGAYFSLSARAFIWKEEGF